MRAVILAALIVSCALPCAPLLSGEPSPADPLDPALLPYLADPAPVHVVVFLRDQPLFEISRRVQADRLPEIRALERQVRAISMRGRNVRQPSGREAERAEARREYMALTPGDRQEMRAISDRISGLLDSMKLEISARMAEAVASEQAELAGQVQRLGGEVIYFYGIQNAIAAGVPGTMLEAIARLPQVGFVELDRCGVGLLDVSLPTIYASTFWNAGETGGSYRPAICDTGVDTSHPALSGHTWTSGVFHDVAKLKANYWDNSASTDDLHGHGTHVSGIATSADVVYRGVAYGSTRALNLKAGYRNTGGGSSMWWADARAAVDWGISTSGFPPHAINFSFGDDATLGVEDTAFARFWDAVVDDKATPVAIAAGNSGSDDATINDPAEAYNILCVANMDDKNTTSRADDSIRASSSRGPVGDGRKKPDITAPGTDIMSCAYDWEGANPDFWSMTGTSMAAPHITGVLTLLADAGVTDAKEQKALMINTADDRGLALWNKTYGWGYVDLDHLYFHRSDVLLGTVTEKDGTNPYDLYLVSGTPADEKTTLVWNRHVVYKNASDPEPWYALNNLDLRLYLLSDGTMKAQSASPRDNVEQVTAPLAGDYVVIVDAQNNQFNGGDDDDYALATERTATALTVPSLSIQRESATYTPPINAKFKARARVQNTGTAPAYNTRVDVGALPAGLTLIAGNNLQIVGTAPGSGYSPWAEWTLKATTAGSKTVNMTGDGYGYGKTYAETPSSFTVTPGAADTVLPTTIALMDWPAQLNGGAEMVNNGGFESSLTGWQYTMGVSVSTSVYHSGAKSCQLAGGGGLGAVAYQDITLHSTPTRIVLQFWYKTNDSGTAGTQIVTLRDSSNAVLWTLVDESSTHDWQQLSVDVTQYKGTTIRIYYGVGGSTGASSTMWLDDVMIRESATLHVREDTPWRLMGKDDRSGVDYCQYQIDAGGWSTGDQFDLMGRSDANHTVDYRCVDNSGNTGNTTSIPVHVDTSLPYTCAMLDSGTLAGSDDRVVNGGFEIGNTLTGWTRSGTTSCSTTVFHGGAKSALIAGGSTAGAIYQDIAVGNSVNGVALSLWYRTICNGIFTAGQQLITLQDTSGNVLETIYWNIPLFNPGYFSHTIVDLSRFRCMTIRLKCEVAASTGGATSGLYVDDVCVLYGPSIYASSSTYVSFAAKDLGAGVDYTEYRIDSGDWTRYSSSFTLSSGTRALSYRSADKLAITENPLSLTINVDSSAPDGAVLIENGAASTNSRNVTLTLTATPSVTSMRFKNEVGDWRGWVAFSSSYAWRLSAGRGTKTVYAQFRDASLNVSPTRSDTIFHETFSVIFVSEARTLQDGTGITLSGAVGSASFSSNARLYVQDPDRCGGIGVVSTQTIAPGDVLEITGTLDTVNGERVLVPTSIYSGEPTEPPRALAVRNLDVGGADFEYDAGPPSAGQKGVVGGTGLNNVGILLAAVGRISAGGSTWFYISDGSILEEGRLKVDGSYLPGPPPEGWYAIVTGVCTVEVSGSDLIPVLRPRGIPDVMTYPP